MQVLARLAHVQCSQCSHKTGFTQSDISEFPSDCFCKYLSSILHTIRLPSFYSLCCCDLLVLRLNAHRHVSVFCSIYFAGENVWKSSCTHSYIKYTPNRRHRRILRNFFLLILWLSLLNDAFSTVEC